MILKRFGKEPSGDRLTRIKKADNTENGNFCNIEPTSVQPKDVSTFKILKHMLNRPKSVRPSQKIPHTKADLLNIITDKPVVVWFGHSSYLLSFKGYNILVDPVFSGFASPFKFFGKSFKGTDLYSAKDFPKIDLLLLTHDHYDHLDYKFLKELKPKISAVLTSLGVGEHLELWGIGPKMITELNWNESSIINSNLKITALPSRHFSGRGIKRNTSLWASYALEWENFNIYIGSDSGYSLQFKEIGKKFKTFDIAFLECGQYGKYWPQIHMFPEETVQAAKDLNAKILFPVHWGKFVLSTHPWNEPVKRLMAQARKQDQEVVAPKIGEPYTFGNKFVQDEWWNFNEKK
ncbi:L-ascorbate metabolism protein UlaG (beta-lactamase superfamily) [Salegentibacter sp. 24]|uniref:MBL fold metallo-hydrolase n=1 Tax=Salegentibacter sp. 24 TaxID=2183986 RepID=UPI0010DF406A|nr:MBL fold metallo-hydrolase [Salegentibacter sp. 24]TDN87917.1 L-ascorbate metabolism protein UlaG (beta-lactamase superfamily) [Salegentibacter sp. 24]